MGRRLLRFVARLTAVSVVVVSGCSADSGVRARSSRTSPSVPSSAESADAPNPTRSPPATNPPRPRVEPTITFGGCAGFVRGPQVPGPQWECGVLVVPMDPADPLGASIELAVTRLRGTRAQDKALVVNPGGPGAPGLQHAWAVAELFPEDVRRLYDVVSWDPRGVGVSAPSLDCPAGSRWSDPDLIAACAAFTGDLSAHMSTANHVEDLESLRRALGQERLDYVGYSYGTYLGALYAQQYPAAVGRFVLDGAVDPWSATERAPVFNGNPWYAADDGAATRARFFDLCDATELCSLGDDSAATYEALSRRVAGLPTDRYPGEHSIDAVTLDAVLNTAFYSPFNWGLIATALEDAVDGDGSTLDALADVYEVSNAYFGDLVDLDETNEAIANLAIYCADFQSHPDLPQYCDGIPGDQRRATVGSIAVETPVLVIGTAFDPSTPGRHADALAASLGDAVTIHWDGIGHTAFPINSLCIDDAVESYLLDGQLPGNGTRCPFIEGVDGDVEEGDYVFGLPPWYVEPWIVDALEGGSVGDIECRAAELAAAGDRIVVHIVLGVESPAAIAARAKAGGVCS